MEATGQTFGLIVRLERKEKWCVCQCARLFPYLVRLLCRLVEAFKCEVEFSLFEVEVSKGAERRGMSLLGRGTVEVHGALFASCDALAALIADAQVVLRTSIALFGRTCEPLDRRTIVRSATHGADEVQVTQVVLSFAVVFLTRLSIPRSGSIKIDGDVVLKNRKERQESNRGWPSGEQRRQSSADAAHAHEHSHRSCVRTVSSSLPCS